MRGEVAERRFEAVLAQPRAHDLGGDRVWLEETEPGAGADQTAWPCPKWSGLKSHDGKKKLGGPYKTKAEAEKRLAQVERFKKEK
jgi:hypothetical protein